MIGETMIRMPVSPIWGTGDERLKVSTQLIVRRQAAQLAYSLSRYYIRKSDPIPQVILEWKAICQSDDEFDEIRNEWIILDSS